MYSSSRIGIPSGYRTSPGVRPGGRTIVGSAPKPRGGTPLKRPTPQQVKNRMSPGRLRKIASERRVASERRY